MYVVFDKVNKPMLDLIFTCQSGTEKIGISI